MEPLIAAKHLTIGYENNILLNAVEFELFQGKIYGLKGKNGSGKSTLLNTIVSRRKPLSGTIEVNASDEEVGYCVQHSNLHARMTPEDTLEILLYLNGKKFVENVFLDSLNEFEKDKWNRIKNRQVCKLSGGEKKWVSILANLELDRKIMIFDEPMSGLDKESRDLVWASIKRKKEQGVLALITSHIDDELKGNTDLLLVINNRNIKINEE